MLLFEEQNTRTHTSFEQSSLFIYETVLAASQLRGSCLRHSRQCYSCVTAGPHNTNASLIVSIRSLRSLILTASPNREEHAHAHVLLFEEQTRTRGENELANNEKTVANTCIRHVVACMLALPMCVHVREPQGRVSKTAYSHCKHIVSMPKIVNKALVDNWNNQP